MINSKIESLMVVGSLLLSIGGCSSAPVRTIATGDRIELTYSCRLQDGSLAATTDRLVANDPGQRKSPLYMAQKDNTPLRMTIGELPKQGTAGFLSFEQEIEQRLAKETIGKLVGERGPVALSAETPNNLKDEDRFLKMATIRKRAKEMRLSRTEYENKTGKTPEVGQKLVIDPLLPGTVTGVTEQEVTVGFTPVTMNDLPTPFGPAKVRDAGQQYEIELKVQQGQLVRSGPLAGVISAVEDDSFTIDYGNPLAGEQLFCDVTVDLATDSVKEADNK